MKILKSEDIKGILSLARWTLRENEEYLNSLNVFPVPDGDTGTNMYLTVDSGWYAIKTDTNGTLKNVLQLFSREAVMGARGNSGIILAQFFAGVKDITDTEEYIPLSLIPSILDHATKEAIYSIVNPVRGTILTVMEEVRDAVQDRSFRTMEELSEFIVRVGYDALNRTPDLLPILKEAGVVDAGAQGFCLILDAFNAYLTGKKPKIIDIEVDKRGEVWHTRSFNRFCVNITIDTHSFKIKEKLKKLGDSLIVGHEENL
ncbi:MAG: DAK2 domain-containing protein, partial [bacterium]|nr:DAK2 domain-containing protein [bacterium]